MDPNGTIHLDPDLVPGLVPAEDREWARLAGPGTWWTGAERLAIAAATRRAHRGGGSASDVLDELTREVVTTVAAEASRIDPDLHDDWTARGLHPYAYVELIGIVARLSALDTTRRGLGLEPRPLPRPLPGSPTREVPTGASPDGGWAPTVGPAGAPNALSAVPPEADALLDLHDVLYLSIPDMDLSPTHMAELAPLKSLTRPQMELVAARTSRLNECFY